jgi:hypothetical protein
VARRILGQLLATLLVTALALLILVATGRLDVPARWNPFSPLDVREAPTLVTAWKFWRLERDPALCRAALATAGFAAEPVPDLSSEGCGYENAVRVARTRLALSAPFIATCPLAVAWALVERHAVEPAARRHLGREVSGLRHYGTYSCRNIYHRAEARLSRHARAEAIDIAGFALADGSTTSLLADWNGPDAGRRAFWRAVRDGACDFFDVVLSPDYNAAHRDHLHLDLNGGRACR